MSQQFFITPTAQGVRVVANGISFFKPYTPDMLLNMGLRFIEAGKEAIRTPPDPKEDSSDE